MREFKREPMKTITRYTAKAVISFDFNCETSRSEEFKKELADLLAKYYVRENPNVKIERVEVFDFGRTYYTKDQKEYIEEFDRRRKEYLKRELGW